MTVWRVTTSTGYTFPIQSLQLIDEAIAARGRKMATRVLPTMRLRRPNPNAKGGRPTVVPDFAALFFQQDVRWQEKAACAGLPTALFFSETPSGNQKAIRICGGCPVQTECLDYATSTATAEGVWGGRIFRKGKVR